LKIQNRGVKAENRLSDSILAFLFLHFSFLVWAHLGFFLGTLLEHFFTFFLGRLKWGFFGTFIDFFSCGQTQRGAIVVFFFGPVLGQTQRGTIWSFFSFSFLLAQFFDFL
jgi:hypothetical protein